MDLSSILQERKQRLRPTKMLLTNEEGRKFEIYMGITKELNYRGTPFVIDEKPDLQIASIVPGLFLSSQDPVFHLDILKCQNIKHILSVGIDPPIKFDEINYHFMDMYDLPEFDIKESLTACMKIINIHKNENVLVHCNAGVSRSPTVIIAYLMIHENLNYDEAFHKVKLIRNCIQPNSGFIHQLKNLRKQSVI